MLRAIDEVKGYSQDGEVINSYVLVLFLFLFFSNDFINSG